MIELLQFIFSDIWHFFGFWLLLATVFSSQFLRIRIGGKDQ